MLTFEKGEDFKPGGEKKSMAAQNWPLHSPSRRLK